MKGNSLNPQFTDSDRLHSLLDQYLKDEATYRAVIYRNEHTEKEAAQAEYALLRSSKCVAHMLHELILRDQIVILDIPAGDYKPDDVDPEYGQALAERRQEILAKFEHR